MAPNPVLGLTSHPSLSHTHDSSADPLTFQLGTSWNVRGSASSYSATRLLQMSVELYQ